MNRFEALHTLGLEEGATPEDVRLAYYGITSVVEVADYADSDQIVYRVDGLLTRAKESRAFLLNPHNQRAMGVTNTSKVGKQEKLQVTPQKEKEARLHGWESVRKILVSYLISQQSKRNNSVVTLIVCIAVGFLVLRYIRMMPARITAFTVLLLIVIAASTVLSTSAIQVKKTKGHLVNIDSEIDQLRIALGMEPLGDTIADARPAWIDYLLLVPVVLLLLCLALWSLGIIAWYMALILAGIIVLVTFIVRMLIRKHYAADTPVSK